MKRYAREALIFVAAVPIATQAASIAFFSLSSFLPPEPGYVLVLSVFVPIYLLTTLAVRWVLNRYNILPSAENHADAPEDCPICDEPMEEVGTLGGTSACRKCRIGG